MNSLNLRFTQGETSGAPPELAAFTAVDRGLLGEQDADHDDRTPLADLVAAGIVNRHLRMVVDDEPDLRQIAQLALCDPLCRDSRHQQYPQPGLQLCRRWNFVPFTLLAHLP